MGTEYYIVKPNKKQMFYLGKRISYLEGISCKEPDWCTWEDYLDVFNDLHENSPYFFENDLYIKQVYDFAQAILDFCDDKVCLDNDCSSTFSQYKDYEEIDDYTDILTTKEAWCELINLVPREYWVTKDNIVYEFETVEKYLMEVRK